MESVAKASSFASETGRLSQVPDVECFAAAVQAETQNLCLRIVAEYERLAQRRELEVGGRMRPSGEVKEARIAQPIRFQVAEVPEVSEDNETDDREPLPPPESRCYSSLLVNYPSEAATTQNSSRYLKNMLSTNDHTWARNHSRIKKKKALKLRNQIEFVMESVMGILIIVNLIEMGISSDVHNGHDGWLIADAIFSTAFVLEIMVLIAIHGWRYFSDRHWLMNILDAFLAILGGVEAAVNINIAFSGRDGGKDRTFSLFRFVRLCRVARVARLLRFPIFRDLLAMIDGVAGGLHTLMWSIVLVLFPLYAIALLLRETLGKSDGPEVRYFSSMGLSMFTVFRCLLGDCSSDRGTPIFLEITENHGWVWGVLYALAIMLAVFGLFNVVTAIFVERTVDAAKTNEALQRRRRFGDQCRVEQLTGELVVHFVHAVHGDPIRGSEISQDSLHTLDFSELQEVRIEREMFKQVMVMDDVMKILAMLDVGREDCLDLDELFDALDAKGNGKLSVGQLIHGFHKLRGDPRRRDIIENGLAVRAVQVKLDGFAKQALALITRTLYVVEGLQGKLMALKSDHRNDQAKLEL